MDALTIFVLQRVEITHNDMRFTSVHLGITILFTVAKSQRDVCGGR